MKAVTEFASFKINQGLKTKGELAAAGKSPEEIEAGLGESFKLEGEKLKFFVNAIEVAGANMEKLTRVIVLTLNEGEPAPAKATQIDTHYYLPEYLVTAKPVAEKADTKGGRGGRGGGRGKGGHGDKPKSSPWGESPDEVAAKKAAAKAAAAAKK